MPPSAISTNLPYKAEETVFKPIVNRFCIVSEAFEIIIKDDLNKVKLDTHLFSRSISIEADNSERRVLFIPSILFSP